MRLLFQVFFMSFMMINALKTRLQSENEHIQCIVSDGIIENSIGFEKHKT
jgi:hypothetical protein